MKDLKINRTYLIKTMSGKTLFSITILLITETSYYLRWNNGLNSNNTWNIKNDMCYEFILVEDITNFIMDNSSKEIFINCIHCNGMGIVLDNYSTSGSKICPYCYGTKLTYKK